MARVCRERQDRERAERELRLIRITRGDAAAVNELQRELVAGLKPEVRSQKSEAGSRKRGRSQLKTRNS